MTCDNCGEYLENISEAIMISQPDRAWMSEAYQTWSFDGAPWDAYCPVCGHFMCDAMSVIPS